MSFIIFGQTISTIQVLTGLVILLLIAVLVLIMRGRGRSEDDMLEAEHNMATLLRAQA